MASGQAQNEEMAMSRFSNQPYRVARTCPLLLAYDAKKRRASVRLGGEIRQLKAHRSSTAPLTVRVHGFAAAFENGNKVWPATATFVQYAPASFKFYDLTLHGFVPG